MPSVQTQELCVIGFIQQHFGLKLFPKELQMFCIDWYVTKKDYWKKEHVDKGFNLINNGFTLETPETLVRSSNVERWGNAFGTFEVKKGEMNVWRFQVFKYGHQDKPAIFVGIIDNAQKNSKFSSFFASYFESGKDGHAYYTYHGTKYNGDYALPYGSGARHGSTITMTLDMTQKQYKYGTLSFKVDGVDQGIATTDIDVGKTYCMAVATGSKGNCVKIID